MSFGPNSGPDHNSALVYVEAQIDYIVKRVSTLLGKNLKMLDVKPEVQKRQNKKVRARLAKTNWNSGCSSWCLTEDGYNASLYPGFATQFKRQMRRLNRDDYLLKSA